MNNREFDSEMFEMMFWAYSVGQASIQLDNIHERLVDLLDRYAAHDNAKDLFMEDLNGVKDEIFLIRRQIAP